MISLFRNRSKKTFILFLLLFLILSVTGLSLAYYIGDIIGNRNNSILLHTVDYGTITVTFPETNGTINMGTVNLDEETAGDTLPYFLKFQIYNSGDYADTITINWSNLTNTFCQYRDDNYVCTNDPSDTYVGDELTYQLYSCTEALYNNITTADDTDIASCTKISAATDEAVPVTGSTTKLHTATKLTLNSDTTYYYVLLINLENLDTNQNYQLDKTLSTGISISRYVSTLTNEMMGVYTPVADNISSTYVTSSTGIDFSKRSDNPYYAQSINSSQTVSFTSAADKAVGTSFTFNTSTGSYSLTNTASKQTYDSADVGSYTCNSSDVSCATMYKILTVGGSTVTSVDIYTAVVDTSIWNGKGLYYTDNSSYIEGINRIYYFRGTVENNVIFAGFCWKIVRTTDSDGIKLIYSGIPSSNQCTTSYVITANGAYNSLNNDNAYEGYMYGSTGQTTYEPTHTNTNNSTIKTYLDNWYASNLTSYTSYLENVIYCNDRQQSTSYSTLNGLGGYGTVTTYYGATIRQSSSRPIFKCILTNDQFTLSEVNGGTAGFGNNKLTYPVGLITWDELSFGGIASNVATTNYLYTTYIYWTMSAGNYNGSATAKATYTTSGFTNYGINGSIGIRPVITLKSNAVVQSGSGTKSDPWIIRTS